MNIRFFSEERWCSVDWKMQNPLWQELYKEVQKKYANVTVLKRTLRPFLNINIYYPKKNPKVVCNIRNGLREQSNLCWFYDCFLLKCIWAKDISFTSFLITSSKTLKRIKLCLMWFLVSLGVSPQSRQKIIGSMVYAGRNFIWRGCFAWVTCLLVEATRRTVVLVWGEWDYGVILLISSCCIVMTKINSSIYKPSTFF
jgi:hypothetical protein